MSVTTDAVTSRAPAGGRRLSAEASALSLRFPPRPVPDRWEATCQDRRSVLARLLAAPFALAGTSGQYQRRFGLIRTLDWLADQPGHTWQERWLASGADADGATDWRRLPLQWLSETGRIAPTNTTARMTLGSGLLQLICADVIRPGIAWLLTTATPQNLAAEMARVRDPDGYAAVHAVSKTSATGSVTAEGALARIAFIMAAKGGMIRDITVGDSLELVEISAAECDRYGRGGKGPYFYQLLHAVGVFPADAPPTERMFSPTYQGQLTAAQLIDRYDLACRPVRDLLVDYLRERQPGLDFTTLTAIATHLGLLFWKDLETHHPGITSLRLAPDVATAWKQRIQTKTVRSRNTHGEVVRTTLPRAHVAGCLITVRAFYLDIAQWATDGPRQVGTVGNALPGPSPGRASRKERRHRKSRTDQRTRERLPVLTVLTATVDRALKDATAL